MAELVEMEEIGQDIGEIEAVEITQPKPEVTVPEIPELPQKYRNKSIEEVVRMAEEADKTMNRHAQEVGEVRKLADELLRSQLTKKAEVEKPKEVDFFENPQEAFRQAIESNPKVVAAEQYGNQMKQELSRQRLAAKHPDLMNVVQDAEFVEWVKASPVRMKLYAEADRNFDFDSGDELLSTFKQLKTVKIVPRETVTYEVDKEARKQAMQSAAVDTGGTSESSRKVYRRADLMRLMQRDPSRYEAMSAEILVAYREGRVK